MITKQQLAKFEQQFDQNPANAVAMNAAVQNGIVKSAMSYEAVRRERHEFSVNLKQGEITNQKACLLYTSRCG